jgi:hypothetical protein
VGVQHFAGEGLDALELGNGRYGEVAGGDHELVEDVGLDDVGLEVLDRPGEFLGVLVVAGALSSPAMCRGCRSSWSVP